MSYLVAERLHSSLAACRLGALLTTTGALLWMGSLAACGQKGPLTLPAGSAAAAAASAPAR